MRKTFLISVDSWDSRKGNVSPPFQKRQLSRDTRFLKNWYEAGDLAKPVWQPLWNRVRCKRGDGGLSSERMLGKTKSMTTNRVKHHHQTVNKIQHHSLRLHNCCIAFITQLIVIIVRVMNHETTWVCAFPLCRYADVCFQDDEAAFGFETGKRRQEGAKIFSLKSLCSNATPSNLNMDSSKRLGSTTWTDPQLRAKMFHCKVSERERKWHWFLSLGFTAQKCWQVFKQSYRDLNLVLVLTPWLNRLWALLRLTLLELLDHVIVLGANQSLRSRSTEGQLFACFPFSQVLILLGGIVVLKEEFTQKWKFLMTLRPPCWWKVGWRFFVHTTLLELYRKIVSQRSPDNFRSLKGTSFKT